MKCACGCNGFSATLVVVGLGALGLGGYNLITTGCPLGICRDSATLSSVAPAADVRTVADRAPERDASCDAAKSECPLSKGDACAKASDPACSKPCDTPCDALPASANPDVTVHVAPPAASAPAIKPGV